MTEQTEIDHILFMWSDMHSHCDIEERDAGFAVIRTFEIDDDMLDEYRCPPEQIILWRKSLVELHQAIRAFDYPTRPVPKVPRR